MATKSKFGTGGGGVNSKQHVKPTVRGGPSVTKKINVEAASAQGAKRGNQSMGGVTSPTNKAARPPLVEAKVPQVPSGNAVALNVGRGGPGAGRVVHSSGSQSQHGPVVQGSAVPPQGSGPGSFGFRSGGK
jgi:hypothetical protein